MSKFFSTHSKFFIIEGFSDGDSCYFSGNSITILLSGEYLFPNLVLMWLRWSWPRPLLFQGWRHNLDLANQLIPSSLLQWLSGVRDGKVIWVGPIRVNHRSLLRTIEEGSCLLCLVVDGVNCEPGSSQVESVVWDKNNSGESRARRRERHQFRWLDPMTLAMWKP